MQEEAGEERDRSEAAPTREQKECLSTLACQSHPPRSQPEHSTARIAAAAGLAIA